MIISKIQFGDDCRLCTERAINHSICNMKFVSICVEKLLCRLVMFISREWYFQNYYVSGDRNGLQKKSPAGSLQD